MGQYDNPNTDFNIDSYKSEPIVLVDEVSTNEIYIGVSINGKKTDKPIWQIKRVVKNGNIWDVSQYPDGNQNFIFI